MSAAADSSVVDYSVRRISATITASAGDTIQVRRVPFTTLCDSGESEACGSRGSEAPMRAGDAACGSRGSEPMPAGDVACGEGAGLLHRGRPGRGVSVGGTAGPVTPRSVSVATAWDDRRTGRPGAGLAARTGTPELAASCSGAGPTLAAGV